MNESVTPPSTRDTVLLAMNYYFGFHDIPDDMVRAAGAAGAGPSLRGRRGMCSERDGVSADVSMQFRWHGRPTRTALCPCLRGRKSAERTLLGSSLPAHYPSARTLGPALLQVVYELFGANTKEIIGIVEASLLAASRPRACSTARASGGQQPTPAGAPPSWCTQLISAAGAALRAPVWPPCVPHCCPYTGPCPSAPHS